MLDKTTCTLRAVPGDTPSVSSRAKLERLPLREELG